MCVEMFSQSETAEQVTSEGEMVRNQLPSGSPSTRTRRNHG